MKLRWENNRYLRWGVTAFLVIAASILFYYGIFHMGNLVSAVQNLLGIVAPVTYGVVIAFLLTPVLNFFENKLIYPFLEMQEVKLKKRGKAIIRWICVILCVVLMFVLIYALLMMILPQLINSITNLIYSFPHYVDVVTEWISSFMKNRGKMDSQTLDLVEEYSTRAQEYLTSTFLPQMQNLMKNITSGVFDVISFLKNFIIGAIISLYLMADKEGFVAKGKMITYAALPMKYANYVIRGMRFTIRTFSGYISGKLLDSACVGVMTYIGTTLMDMPYPLLISVFIGVTDVIPFFGPYLGVIPTTFLILLVDPLKALYFVLFILVMQQIDGNIIAPKILGDSTGLSSFMVIVAILVGGGLFGIPGMVIGVPVFAVLYTLATRIVRYLLAYRKIPTQETAYTEVDCLDEETGEPVFATQEKPEEKPEKESPKKHTAFLEIMVALWGTVKKLSAVIWGVLKVAWAEIYKWLRKFWIWLCKMYKIRKNKQQKKKSVRDWIQDKEQSKASKNQGER